MSGSARSPKSQPPASSVFSPDSQLENLPTSERVRSTSRPSRAVILRVWSQGTANDGYGFDAGGGAENAADPATKAAMARPLRNRAAAIQQTLPRTPAGVPYPGTGLRRIEASHAQAAARASRGSGWRRSAQPPSPPSRPTDRRHAADSRVAGGRALR